MLGVACCHQRNSGSGGSMSSVTEQFVVVLFSGWLIGVGVKLVLRNKQGGVSVEFNLWGG